MRARRPVYYIFYHVAEGSPVMRRFLFFILYFFWLPCFAFLNNNTAIPTVFVKAKHQNHFTSTNAPETEITQQEISVSGMSSLPQALQELGGIQMQDTTGNGSQVMLNMRGFGANASSNTLLLVNGIPITNPDLMPADLNAIPLQDIKVIEIVSGSESVLYGDQAVGGIINIVTTEPQKKKGEISCSAGSYDQQNCYATLSNNYKKLNFGLGVGHTHTNNYRERNEYNQSLISGTSSYPYATGNVDFHVQVNNEFMQYPGALTREQVFANRRQAANDTDFFRDWNGIYHLKNQQKLNENWQLEMDLARREMHGDGILTSAFTQSRTVEFFRPAVKGSVGKILVMSGIDLEDDHYHLKSLFGSTDDSQRKYGLYGLANIPLNSRLSLSAGARGAQQDNQLQSFAITNSLNRALAATLGASYLINQDTKIYLRRADSFRFPKADENAEVPVGVRNLKTQRGISYETGMQWYFKNVVSKIGVYQLNLRDEIQFDPTQTPAQPFGVNRNLDPTVRRGAFLTEKLQINDRLSLNGQYNFVRAVFQNGDNAGKHIPLVSENIIRAGINLKLNPRWNLYTEGLFTGNQFADNDNANSQGALGGYTIFNAALHYQWLNFSAVFRVNNIFNKYYYFYTVFQPSLQSEFFYPAPGRNLLLTLKYQFL